jgi:peptide/nickel transport system ATP-binding protein
MPDQATDEQTARSQPTSSDSCPSTTPPLLSVRNLSVVYHGLLGDVTAVDGVSFDLRPGEAVALVGESGSGKSTVAMALMGMLNPKQTTVKGEVRLDDRDLLPQSKRQWQDMRGNDAALIFQDPMTSLNPYLKIGLQITEPILRHTSSSRAEAEDAAIGLLKTMELADAESLMKAYPHEFSGGMRQRAMIASAFSASPRILIADEPTTALDVITQARVLRLMRDHLKRNDMALILITHDLGIVAGVCERVLVMKDGKLVEKGPVDAIYHDPKEPYTQKLLKAVPRIDEGGVNPFRTTSAKKSMSRPLITVENALVTFVGKNKTVTAVNDVSLELRENEILGLVGQSGSGKSTLIRAIAGLQPLTSGSITVDGAAVNSSDNRSLKTLRRNVQMIFQDPLASLNPRWTVERIIAEPLVNYGVAKGRAAIARARELMETVSLEPDWGNRFPHQFSGGQCQRIGIARALALEPKVLLCDEPVSALDVSIQEEVLQLLSSLQERLGLSLLFISHDLAVVRHIADRVAVMCEGEIVELKDAADIYAKAEHEYTKTLLRAVPIPDPRSKWLFQS